MLEFLGLRFHQTIAGFFVRSNRSFSLRFFPLFLQQQEDDEMLVPHSDFAPVVEGPHPMEVAPPETANPIDAQSADDTPSARFTWTIENFTRLNTKKLYSEVFLVGGYKWTEHCRLSHSLSTLYMNEKDTLDFPYEVRFPFGLIMLRYGKAVQESVYEQFRVVREGQLRVIFNPDLKILSWEFCARHHEELVPRSLIAPQVNQLIEAAQKCQSTTEAVISNAVSAQYLQSSCNVFVKEGRRLTGNLELLLVNDLGFPKRYVRCFQIAEVVNYMKELMTFSRDNKIGPIESLKTYPRKETTSQAKQMHGTEWLASAVVSPGSSNTMNEKSDVKKDGIMTGSEKAGLAVKKERSCSINSSIPIGIPLPLQFLSPQSSSPRVIQSPSVSDLSTSQLSQDGDDVHHQTIQNILQQMVYNSRAKLVQSGNTKVKEEVLEELDGNQVGNLSTRAWAPANVLGSTLGRSDYFDAGSNSNFSGIYGENSIFKRENDILERFQLSDAVRDMDYEFFRNGVLSDDWKA